MWERHRKRDGTRKQEREGEPDREKMIYIIIEVCILYLMVTNCDDDQRPQTTLTTVFNGKLALIQHSISLRSRKGRPRSQT